MKNNEYKILSEDAIKYLCGLIRDLASVSEGIDNINLADDKTFSNIYIKNLIDKCLEDANAEAEKLVGALTHLTCEETAIQPTLDNSEINVIYLYSADGNPPYQQFLKISEDKLVDLGSTSISLEDYIKAADVAKDYTNKVELKAVTDKIGTTTLTTTDTTITGAIEEVKGSIEGKADKSEIPTTLPANGGNADTVNNHTVKSDVPENAVFTDTVYDDTKLNAKLDGKADKNAVLNSLEVGSGNYTAQIIPWSDGTHYRGFEDKSNNTYTDIITKDGVASIAKIENGVMTKEAELVTMDKISPIPIEANRTITFSNDYTEISVYRCGYSNIRAHIEIDALCNIIAVGGWVQDMGILLPEGYRPSENISIPAWCSSDTEYHMPITLMIGADGKLSGYIGGSHTSINRLNITVTYFK